MTRYFIGALLLLAACSAEREPEASATATIPDNSEARADASPVAAPPPNASAPASAESAAPTLAVDAEGLRLFDPVNGAARPLAFGQSQGSVLEVLEALRGPAGKGVNSDCGAGPVDYANWPDGLGLAFQSGRFVGWALDRRAEGAVTTASGIGPGSTRAALEDAYQVKVQQTTLGTEFSAGDLFGLVDGAGQSARITYMWAGVSCNAR